MLVLSRKRGERICIGGTIELEVLAVHGRRVKLGITCPADVRILRAELAGARAAESVKPANAQHRDRAAVS